MTQNSQNSLKPEFRPHSNPMMRWIFITGGVVLVSIGILGMFLPLLPTTIFFILAAWCFARSSERYYKWIHSNKYFGKYLSDYRSGKGMPVKSKIFSIAFLWTGILVSFFLLTENLYVRILLAAIAIGVTLHIIYIKTAKDEV